jgi:hypothetical protein
VSNDLAADIGAATLKAAPPAGITAGMVLGAIDPQWLVAIPTCIYVIAQLGYLIWKWRREAAKRG